MLQLLRWCLKCTYWARLGLEEAGVAPLMATLVNQLPLLALVERHSAVGANPTFPELGVDIFIGNCRGFVSR